MANVLPKQFKKNAQREYAFRLGTVVLVFVSIILIFAGILLISSHLVSVAEEEGKIEQIKLVKEYSASRTDDTRKVIFELTKTQLQLIATETEQISLEQIINEALTASNRSGGISLNNIFHEVRDSGDTKEVILVLRGTSSTRGDLLAFTKEIEKQPLFASVDLPVPSLKEDRDLPFSLEIVLEQ